MAVNRIKVTGPLANPTIADADTGEPLLCFTQVELVVEACTPILRLTIHPDCLDISEWGISQVEAVLGRETILAAIGQYKRADTPTAK